MADYYPILARAVSRLATDNAQARQELYEHARTVQAAKLRRYDPQFSAPETINERIAFEAAILRLEAEMRSLGEKSPEGFADHVPLQDANDAPDIASLLREPWIQQSTPIDGAYWDGISASPCLLRPPG
jgi:hypothetical protein